MMVPIWVSMSLTEKDRYSFNIKRLTTVALIRMN